MSEPLTEYEMSIIEDTKDLSQHGVIAIKAAAKIRELRSLMCTKKTELGNVLNALTRSQEEALSFMKEADRLRQAKIVATNKSISLARNNAKLRAALVKFGRHGYFRCGGGACDCGLDAALASGEEQLRNAECGLRNLRIGLGDKIEVVAEKLEDDYFVSNDKDALVLTIAQTLREIVERLDEAEARSPESEAEPEVHCASCGVELPDAYAAYALCGECAEGKPEATQPEAPA